MDENGLAVLKLDVRLQRESERLEIRRKGPFLGQQRRDREILVDLGQPLEDVVVGDFADRRRRRCGRIEARRLEHHSDRDAVFCIGEACGGGQGEGRGGQQARHTAHFRDAPTREVTPHDNTGAGENVKNKNPLPRGKRERGLAVHRIVGLA